MTPYQEFLEPPTVPRVARSVDDLRVGMTVIRRFAEDGWRPYPVEVAEDDLHRGMPNLFSGAEVVVILEDPPPAREPIRLTGEEREALWQSGEVSIINCDHDSNLVAAVESILAARLAGGPTLAVTAGMVEAAAKASHDAYEDAAILHGWETQKRSRKPWADVPEENKATVRDAIRAALKAALAYRTPESEDKE